MLQKLPRYFVLFLSMAVVAMAFPAEAKKPKDPDELFNPLLGPDYSHWLVGPLVEMATEGEVEDFLLLASDEDAEAFVDRFWEARNAGTKVFTKTPQQIFEARAEDADKRFSEGTYPGSRTDRGTILVLFGEPDTIEFESPRKVDDPPLEVWRYKTREKGLHGKKPKKQYRFVDLGRQVVRYTGQTLPPDFRQRLKRRRF
ncbi:MAG: GWxTD domain-containing protein [Acidobacteriota bacterium]